MIPIVDRLKRLFHVRDVCVVADRGMISEETITALEDREWSYILGVRMRSSNEARAVVGAEGRWTEVFPARTQSHDPAPLRVKEVCVGDHRYIVCFNEEQARKDRHDREAIVAALREALPHGHKALVGNKGYRRFLKTQGARFTIDDTKVEEDTRYDGLWVLRTDTDLEPLVVALAYKHLWMVEAIFRSMKSVLETRPVYQQTRASAGTCFVPSWRWSCDTSWNAGWRRNAGLSNGPTSCTTWTASTRRPSRSTVTPTSSAAK